MDIFETLEDEFDEYFDSLTIPRRNPVYRERINYMETLDETDFRARFRLTKKAMLFVFSIIERAISVTTERNRAIRPITRLLLTLRFYATGSFLTVVGDFSGVSKASASRIIYLVSQAIARLRLEFIKFPTNTQEIQQEFYNIAKFPRLIGAIDCTHVPIKSPEAHSMHRRQASDDENYDDPQLGDEAAEYDTMNDTEETKPPSIETNSTSYQVKSGENVTLECKVNPENGTVVSWYRNGLQCLLGTVNLVENDRYSIVNGKSLLITDAETADSGIWRCKTEHETASVYVEHTLLVTEAPQIRSTNATNGGYVVEGSDLHLSCNITASPVPSVVWSVSKNGQNRNLNEKDGEFNVDGTLYSVHIKNIQKENTGKYLCYAFNDIGQDQTEINVVVYGKPRVHVPKTIVNSDLSIEAVLQCSAHETSRPAFRWYKDNYLIQANTLPYVINTEEYHSNLTVTPTLDSDFGIFTCEARNEYGTHNRSIALVQSPVIEDLDVDGNKMAWTVHSHQALEEMELQLQSTNNGEWTTFSIPVPEVRHHKYDISYIIDVNQLQPGEYLATVKVRNTKEWGSSNEPAIVKIEDPQSLSIQTASVIRENNAAHSIRPMYTALSTILMYLLVRML